MSRPKDTTPIGEGNYEAAAKYDKAQEKFAKSGKVKDAAREAAEAVDSVQEGPELEKARKQAALGNINPGGKPTTKPLG